MKLPISQIIIGERQRDFDPDWAKELASSVEQFGLINPITVKKTNDQWELVAGRHRLAAATLLGWTEIDATDRGELTELQHQSIELEEDVKRKDRTWQEKCLALLKLHRIRKLQHSEWDMSLLAACVGKSIGHLSEVLNVARILEQTKEQKSDYEKLLWTVPTLPDAINIIMDKKIEQLSAEMQRRRQVIRPALGLPCKPALTVSSDESVAKGAKQTSWMSTATPVTEDIIKLQIFDKGQTKPSKAFLAFNYKEAKLDESPDFSALFWVKGLNAWQELRATLKEKGYNALAYPIIWNLVDHGPYFKDVPFKLNYRLGLFVSGSAYRNPNLCLPSVITAAIDDDNEIPVQLVQACIDALCKDGEELYLPDGENSPVVQVAQCGCVPVWKGSTGQKRQELIAYYQSIYHNPGII